MRCLRSHIENKEAGDRYFLSMRFLSAVGFVNCNFNFVLVEYLVLISNNTFWILFFFLTAFLIIPLTKNGARERIQRQTPELLTIGLLGQSLATFLMNIGIALSTYYHWVSNNNQKMKLIVFQISFDVILSSFWLQMVFYAIYAYSSHTHLIRISSGVSLNWARLIVFFLVVSAFCKNFVVGNPVLLNEKNYFRQVPI